MDYPQDLRALSIAGPYAWLIGKGWKDAEFRTWPINSLRGLILLHNSTTRDWDYEWEEFIDAGDVTREQAMKQKGHIIGFAFLTGCESAKPDGHDGYYHLMDGPALFDQPVPAPGARSYWQPRREAQQQAFSQAWELIQAGNYTPVEDVVTDAYLEEYGYKQPRTFTAGPDGQTTVN